MSTNKLTHYKKGDIHSIVCTGLRVDELIDELGKFKEDDDVHGVIKVYIK